MSLFRTKIFLGFISTRCIFKDRSSVSGAFAEWKCFATVFLLTVMCLPSMENFMSQAMKLWTRMLPAKSCTCCSSGVPFGAQHPSFLIGCAREATHKSVMLALFKDKAPQKKKSISKLTPKYTYKNMSVHWVATRHVSRKSYKHCLYVIIWSLQI